MSMFDFLRPKPRQNPVQPSRPIFQSSSSFINDENNIQRPAPTTYLPTYHNYDHHHDHHQFQHSTTATIAKEYYNDSDNENDTESLLRRKPAPLLRLHITLHTLSAILSLTSLSLFIAVIPLWNLNFRHSASLISTDYTDGLILAPLLLSLFISIYLLLTQYTPLRHHLRPRFHLSNKHHSPHPRTIRASKLAFLSATVLLTLIPTLALSGSNSLALTWRDARRTRNGQVVCNIGNMFAAQCQPVLYQIGGLQVAGVVVGGLVGIVWLVIGVIAVRAWMAERRERERLRRERRLKRRERRGRTRRRGGDERYRAAMDTGVDGGHYGDGSAYGSASTSQTGVRSNCHDQPQYGYNVRV